MFSSRKFKQQLTELIPRLNRYARVLAPSAADADDLLQATCERALSRASQWDPNSKLDAWAFTIMNSIWKNELRSRAIRQGKGFVDLDTLTAPSHSQPHGNIFLTEVLTMVQALPENQREIILLCYVEGYSYKEIASILEIPIGTVMSRLSRARSTLSDQMKQQDMQIPTSHTKQSS